jgi:hypothetical protein
VAAGGEEAQGGAVSPVRVIDGDQGSAGLDQVCRQPVWRERARRTSIAAMPTSRPVRLALELQAAGRRVTGTLTDERCERHPFGNWLQLLTLLEAARLRSLSSDDHQTHG